MPRLLYGDSAARLVSGRICEPQSTLAALAAIPADRCVAGMTALVTADGSRWVWSSSSTLTADNVLVAGAQTAGRWLRAPGFALLKLPFTFATADNAVLLAVPAGCLLMPLDFAWEVSADFTGGSSSAIGLSSNKTGYTAAGDLLGGAGGNVAAALTAALSPNPGTIGTTWDTLPDRRAIWKATENFIFERITSAFTAGAGNVLVAANILQNAGA